jgi:Holliday junction resolvase-like predicted endonuclease
VVTGSPEEAVEEMAAGHLLPAERSSLRPVKTGAHAKVSSEGLPAVTSSDIGSQAETKVAEYLESLGHEIVARNFKTRMCEIDIVSTQDEKIYFTEVKYRKSGARGTGLEMITVGKFRKMQFAAESYMKFSKSQHEPQLAVASVRGADFVVQDFLVLT